MAKCPICGSPLDWGELIEQMLKEDRERLKGLLKDSREFLEAFKEFTFRCPSCGEEFYGSALPEREAKKVFELLNEFKGSIDWENERVKLRLNSLLALDTMLEGLDKKLKG
ncbi:MAG: hypothetical protein PWQ95_1503 [Thermococcaceae archaeon]|nr:hypothetical protein [Thermococcaceae archaeon]